MTLFDADHLADLSLMDMYSLEAAHDLLTHAEEIDLARRVRSGGADGHAARQVLAEKNLRLVISIAARYQGHTPLPDLIGFGNEGLLKAISKYDPELGHRFSTYATWWIRHFIRRGLEDTGRLIRVPTHMGQRIFQYNRALAELLTEQGTVTDEELCVHLDWTQDYLANTRAAILRTLSLETPVGHPEGNAVLADTIPDAAPPPSAAAEAHSLRDAVRDALSDLSPREAHILSLRFGLDGQPLTLKEVGDKYGLTRERIRQIESSALQKLRHPSRARILRAYLDTD